MWQNHDASHYRQRSIEELQRLKQKQEIPIRSRNVIRVSGVGQPFERHARRHRHDKQNGEGHKIAAVSLNACSGKNFFVGPHFVARRRRDSVFAHQEICGWR